MNFDINDSTEFLSSKMSKFSSMSFAHVMDYHAQKTCKKVFYIILLKFGHFTQNLKISAVFLPWK